jgi:hypothetical protein
LLPNETFLQITNCKEDIAFGNNIEVDLIDICQNVVQSLTVNENFFFEEFTDIKGTKQITYEFGNIGVDYFQELLFLRLKHTVSDAVWYSAGFFVTETLKEETTYFQYTSGGYFQGISYDIKPYFQTIRLTCFKSDIDPQTEAETITQLSGNTYALRPIITNKDKYLFYTCDAFTYARVVRLLSHPIVYINGQRANTTSSNLTKGDRETDSNFFNVDFESNPTEELSTVKYQIYQPLDIISKMPDGLYTIADFNTATDNGTYFQLVFSKPFTITADISAKVYKDGVFFAEFLHTDFVISGVNLYIDTSANPITEAGIYDVVIGANNVYSINELATEYWSGFEYGQWEFEIVSDPLADYNASDYNASDYYTT